MSRKIKLPHSTRYVSGSNLGLNWLITISVNDYVAARHTDWHQHDELEIIYPVHGHYRYEFKRHKPVDIDGNLFLVIPKGCVHRLADAIDSPGLRFSFHLKEPAGRFAAKGAFSAGEYGHLYECLSTRAFLGTTTLPALKPAISALSKILTLPGGELSEINRLRARVLCYQLLCEGVAAPDGKDPTLSNHTISEAVNWLEQNFATATSLDPLVAFTGYSRTQFFALFKKQVGQTPSEYLRNHRLDKAKELLARSDLPASEISQRCGFASPAHFSRLFLKMTGLTPLGYRNRNLIRGPVSGGAGAGGT